MGEEIENKKYYVNIENSDAILRDKCNKKAHALYGENLPPFVEIRLNKELSVVRENRWAEHYIIAMILVEYAKEKGFCVTARGYIGAALISFLLEITEINPLEAHYLCPKCHFIDMGSSLKEKSFVPRICPKCGERIVPYGEDIRPEMAWGSNLSKEPEICLNYAPSIVEGAIGFLREKFGEANIIGAGTKMICDDDGTVSFGTHPGGFFIVPKEVDIHKLAPLKECVRDDGITLMYAQRDYHEIERYLKKYDILSYKPLEILHREEKRTGCSIDSITIDNEWIVKVPDEKIQSFYKDEEKIVVDIVSPKNFWDIIKIEGLLHIDFYTAEIEERIDMIRECNRLGITCRDDLLDKFLSVDLQMENAYKIMSHISNGQGLWTDDEEMLRGTIDSEYLRIIKGIRYLYPRSMTSSYALMKWRLMYYELHFPEAYKDSLLTMKINV